MNDKPNYTSLELDGPYPGKATIFKDGRVSILQRNQRGDVDVVLLTKGMAASLAQAIFAHQNKGAA